MSAKWIRSKQWDDEHIPSWAWPVKFLLRAFSSIPTAVVLLSLVVVYAILASVPIGLIVLGLTYLIYGLTLLATVAVLGIVPVLILRILWKPKTPGAAAGRFVVSVLAAVVLCALAAEVWYLFAWPRLMYVPAVPATATSPEVPAHGVRLFADFVEEYRSITLRRLPGFEMSELEFYSWWPLRVILLLFVVNLVVATVRRIEFSFPYIGVLTVHTGIVVIALGSIYYKGLKQEGDTLLWAGEPGPDGRPIPGPPQGGFYDNTRAALWIRINDAEWEQRPIQPPRYNDYNLNAGGGVTVFDAMGGTRQAELDRGRTLSIPVPRPEGSRTDPDLSFRLVGYAVYAEPRPTWVKADPPADGKAQPVRFAQLIGKQASRTDSGRGPMKAPFFFLPDLPAQRLGETEVFGLEYTRGMPDQRFIDLAETLPDNALHALVVEVPEGDGRPAFRAVYAAEPGKTIAVGDTGYTLEVKQLAPQPPFPIITAGYQGATSSVAIVRVTPPAPPDGKPAAFERWVYHRFPEINQDLLDELNERGMPRRRDADPAIRIAYIDASKLQVYVDERTQPERGHPAGSLRAIVRVPRSPARIIERVGDDGLIADLMPGLDLRLTERWDHAVEVERPQVVPERDRDKSLVGTHANAMLAVEVSSTGAGQPWSRVVWLPFTKYLASGLNTERSITLPDGRTLTLAFGRIRYRFPDFLVRLVDFQMIAYEHRGAPRDYQATLEVIPLHDGAGPPPFKPYTHVASLNAPLQAPFRWSDERSWFANVMGTFASRLSPRQFKLSQAGWDQQTWAETQRLVDEGRLPRPYVRFTILGVGNNPGIHIIALGGILMSVGIPWAFYVKPWLMRRRRDRLKASLAAQREPQLQAPRPELTGSNA